MYEAMDLLYEHASEVEKAVFFHTANLFNLEVDLIFYDTTTASFSTDYEDDPELNPDTTLRCFGHSKEGTWSPQVVVALAVTREGIPVRSWVMPGNTADTNTVEKVRADLRGWNLGRTMFVADSGMNAWLKSSAMCSPSAAVTRSSKITCKLKRLSSAMASGASATYCVTTPKRLNASSSTARCS
jgi:transposase